MSASIEQLRHYFEQEMSLKNILEMFDKEDLALLFQKIPKDAPKGKYSWWTPDIIETLKYHNDRESVINMIVVPRVMLSALINSQLIEDIKPHPIYDDEDTFFTQYRFLAHPNSIFTIPSQYVENIKQEYTSGTSQLSDPDSARNVALAVSRKHGFALATEILATSVPEIVIEEETIA